MGASSQNLEEFYRFGLGLPPATRIDKPIFKKMLLNNAELSVADKKALKELVERITWLATIKPENTLIPAYEKDGEDYSEVEYIHVALHKAMQLERISKLINAAIPYPIVLLFSVGDDDAPQISIWLASKRDSQADKSKVVIENTYHTGLIDLNEPTAEHRACLDRLHFPQTNQQNLKAFYGSLIEPLLQLQLSQELQLQTGSANALAPLAEDRLKDKGLALEQARQLNQQVVALQNQLKKTKQLNKQITLNTEIKTIRDQLAALKAQFQG